MTKVTNLQRATEMVKNGTEGRMTKADIINHIMAELNVSKANALDRKSTRLNSSH